MNSAKIIAKFVTPALLAGAEQKTAELRAPSIRGQLRWWMKTALNFEDEAELEDELFGSAKGNAIRRSKVIVRANALSVSAVQSNCTADKLSQRNPDYFLWPLRNQENARGIIKAGTEFSFSVQMRGNEDNEDLEFILKAFLLLGSLGSRSRRAYGSIWPVKVEIDGEPWDIPQNEEDLTDELEYVMQDCKCMKVFRIGMKPFNSWKDAVDAAADYMQHWRCGSPKFGQKPTDYGKNDHDAGLGINNRKCVYRAGLGLPLTQRYSSTRANLESSVSGLDRFASPLHFKVIALDGGFVPLAVFMKDDLLQNEEVSIVNRNTHQIRKYPLNNTLFFAMMGDSELHCIAELPPPEEEEEEQ